RAVNSGVWPLYRFDPRRIDRGEPPLVVEHPSGKVSVDDYMRNETRFRIVERLDPDRFRRLAVAAREHSARRVALYEQLSRIVLPIPAAPQTNGAEPVLAGGVTTPAAEASR